MLEAAGHDEGLGATTGGASRREVGQPARRRDASRHGSRGSGTSGVPGCTAAPTISCGGSGRPTCSGRRRCPRRSSACDALQLRRETRSTLQAGAATTLGRLLAMQGDVDEARELLAFGQDFYRSAGMARQRCGRDDARGVDRASRRRSLRPRRSTSGRARRASRPRRSGVLLDRGRSSRSVPLPQGRFDEAGDMCTVVRERKPRRRPHQLRLRRRDRRLPPVQRGSSRGGRGARSTGRRRCRDDRLLLRAGRRRGSCSPRRCPPRMRQTAASRAAAFALALLDAKGDITGAARARERLDELGIEVA